MDCKYLPSNLSLFIEEEISDMLNKILIKEAVYNIFIEKCEIETAEILLTQIQELHISINILYAAINVKA